MLVRDVDKGVMTMVDPMGALMEEAGIIKIRKIGAADVKLMKANEVYEFTAREMKRDPHLLYFVEKKDF
jgi:aminoglycoside N3'-acetyltransferase